MHFWLAISLDHYCQTKIRVNWCLCAGQEHSLLCCPWCCIGIRDTVFISDQRGWLWQQATGLSEEDGEKKTWWRWKKEKPGEVAEARKCRQENLWIAKTVLRSKYKELSSEALCAIVPVTFCKALLNCHKNKVSSFSGLVPPFLWQIQNVLLKPVWKCHVLLQRGTKDRWKITPEADKPWVTRSSSAEINSKQQVPTEMTCVHETDQSPWYFSQWTHPAAFSSKGLLSLDPICQSVYTRKCPSSREKQQKMSEGDVIW